MYTPVVRIYDAVPLERQSRNYERFAGPRLGHIALRLEKMILGPDTTPVTLFGFNRVCSEMLVRAFRDGIENAYGSEKVVVNGPLGCESDGVNGIRLRSQRSRLPEKAQSPAEVARLRTYLETSVALPAELDQSHFGPIEEAIGDMYQPPEKVLVFDDRSSRDLLVAQIVPQRTNVR